MMNSTMKVIKRNGVAQGVSFDKILLRNKKLCEDGELFGLPALPNVDPIRVSQMVVPSIRDGMTTVELDILSASQAQSLCTTHPEYSTLAARILVSNMQKNTEHDLAKHFFATDTPSEEQVAEISSKHLLYTMRAMWENINDKGHRAPLISPHMMAIVAAYAERFEAMIDYSRDYCYEYGGFIKLEDTYLQKAHLRIGASGHVRRLVERPQHMIMREAIAIMCSRSWREHAAEWPVEAPEEVVSVCDAGGSPVIMIEGKKMRKWTDAALNTPLCRDIVAAVDERVMAMIAETYRLRSEMYFTHASPTLYNAGTLFPQLSSCFLIALPADSMEGITELWKLQSLTAKHAGGVGIHIHALRATGSYIAGNGGRSDGAEPMIHVCNDIAVYVKQGGNKRDGSTAIYNSPTHPDYPNIVKLKRHDAEHKGMSRSASLYYGLWTEDEFMWRVEAGMQWYFMCPDACPGLADVYNRKFSKTFVPDEVVFANPSDWAFSALYRTYIRAGRYHSAIAARDLWREINITHCENGMPYMTFKDAGNRKSNQMNIGTIKSSNLCTEIFEVSSAEETAVCNLASVCLPKFVRDGAFAFDEFGKVVEHVVETLNRIIDINFYPHHTMEKSNMRHRPIGIGVQGLADLFAIMRMPFDSAAAMELNHQIFEQLYYSALTASTRLAERDGAYLTFAGSPASQGRLQFDLWAEEGALGSNPEDDTMVFPMRLVWEPLRERIVRSGLRNSLLVAPMPTASTSDIMGNSPCFEPYNGNIYVRKTRAVEYTVVNKYLIADLIRLGLWNESMKHKMLAADGSIQEIESIPRDIRNLYKTVWDLKPHVVIKMSIARGRFVCQSQSLNLYVARPTPDLLTRLLFYGWRRGLKTGSYYIHSMPSATAQKIQVDKKAVIADAPMCRRDNPDCDSCGA